MGFLDNSTNNIIVDAVLTDKGREMLAKGQFNISTFAFGDDEVDYTIIKKFGRTIGKEKIEKNTPIFEAQTNADLGLKHRLLSFTSGFITNIPNLSTPNFTTNTSVLTRGSGAGSVTTCTFSVGQVLQDGGGAAQQAMREDSWIVHYDERFLTIRTNSAVDFEGNSAAGLNNMRTVHATGLLGVDLQVTADVRSFSDDFYNYYATYPNSGKIQTIITVYGGLTGKFIQQPITIKKDPTIT